METVTDNILDVTILDPKVKHPTIFGRIDELKEGESLTIHNDHDPKPLYYHLMAEKGNIFDWEYLEQGPQWWKVKITIKITGVGSETLGDIVVKDFRKAKIFKKYGLDFCCNGWKTIKEACAEAQVNLKQVERELQEIDKVQDNRSLPYNDWSLSFLADYIVNTHHLYLRKNLPEILNYSAKVNQVHSNNHPELAKINQIVQSVAKELNSHMEEEEKILFPYIKDIDSGSVKQGVIEDLVKFLHKTEHEHRVIGANLEEIESLTQNYTLPSDACASYTLLYNHLKVMDEDVRLHIHLENNILFPKALAKEKAN